MSVLRCLVAIAACAAFAAPASSCINTFEPELLYSLEQRDAEAARITQDLEKAHAEKPTLENSNDFGVALLLSTLFLLGFLFYPPDAIALVMVSQLLHGFFYGITIPLLWP